MKDQQIGHSWCKHYQYMGLDCIPDSKIAHSIAFLWGHVGLLRLMELSATTLYPPCGSTIILSGTVQSNFSSVTFCPLFANVPLNALFVSYGGCYTCRWFRRRLVVRQAVRFAVNWTATPSQSWHPTEEHAATYLSQNRDKFWVRCVDACSSMRSRDGIEY